MISEKYTLKKINKNILQVVMDHQARNRDPQYPSNTFTIETHLREKYTQDEIKKAIKLLINSGYLKSVGSNIYMTDKGKNLLEEHNEFLTKPLLTRLNIFFKENLAPIISLSMSFISLGVSIIGLLIKT